MKNLKQILAIFLAIALVFPILPAGLSAPLSVGVSASRGSGTQSDPYLIRDYWEFHDLTVGPDQDKTQGKFFKQDGDFEMSFDARYRSQFHGNYNGDGYTITLVSATQSVDSQYAGLFHELSPTATVENMNVVLKGVKIRHGNNARNEFGVITGINAGLIRNCSVSGELNYTTTATSDAFVGGISGNVSRIGKTQACYSSITLVVGSESENIIYAGGIAGMMYTDGTIIDCLVENTNIYMGNAAGKGVSTGNTYAHAGAIIGHVAYGTPVIQRNVRRGGTIDATLSSGKGTASMFGITFTRVNLGSIKDNYTDTWGNALGAFTGYSLYVCANNTRDFNGLALLQTGATENANPDMARFNDPWLNNTKTTEAGNELLPNLKWRTFNAPTMKDTSTANDNSFKVIIEPPTDKRPPIELTTKVAPADIRYKLTVSSESRLAAPTVTRDALTGAVSGGIVTLTPPANAVAYYGKTSDNITTKFLDHAIPIPAVGTPDIYWIQSKYSGTGEKLADSKPRKMTVTKADDTISATVDDVAVVVAYSSTTVNAEEPYIQGKLATPDVVLNGTSLELSGTGTLMWKLGTGGTYLSYATNPISLGAASGSTGVRTYYVKAMSSDTVKYDHSGELKVTVSTNSTPATYAYQAPTFANENDGTPAVPAKLATPTVELNDDKNALMVTFPAYATGIMYKLPADTDYIPYNPANGITLPTPVSTAVYEMYATGTGVTQSDSMTVTVNNDGTYYTTQECIPAAGSGDIAKTLAKLATPTVTLDGNTLVIVAAAGGTAKWKLSSDINYTLTSTISLGTPTSASTKTYQVVSVGDNTTATDSVVKIVTVKSTLVTAGGYSYSVAEENSNTATSYVQGKLATPKPTRTGGNIALSYVSTTTPAPVNPTIKFGTSSPTTPNATIAIPLGTTTYYAQAFSSELTKHANSGILEIKAERKTGDVLVALDGVDTDYGAITGDKKVYTNDSNITGDTPETVIIDDTSLTITQTGLTIAQGSTLELVTWVNRYPSLINTQYIKVAGKTAMPMITPDATGNLANGITMATAQQGTKIFYTMTFDGSDPADPVTTVTTEGTTKEYTGVITWDYLKDKFTGGELRIKAIATSNITSELASNVTPIMEYTKINKKPFEVPKIIVGDTGGFNPEEYYTSEQVKKITLTHSDIIGDSSKDGKIYYTTNGKTPTNDATINPVYSGAFELPPNKNAVDIKAAYFKTNYPSSEVMSSTVKVKLPHGEPIFSIENNTSVPIGQQLTFLLRQEDIPAQIIPNYYMREGDPKKYTYSEMLNQNADYYGVLVLDYVALGLNDANARANYYSLFNTQLPTLVYKKGTGEPKTYKLGNPEIRFVASGVEDETMLIPHTQSDKISLDGTAGSSIIVSAHLEINQNTTGFEPGKEKINEYSFFAPAEKPVATPPSTVATKPDEPVQQTQLAIGTRISITSATAGAKIFYSLTGTPQVIYDRATGNYSSADPDTTKEYIPKDGIVVEGTPDGFFNIWAVSTKNGMSESETAAFTYKISALALVANPTSYPATTNDKVTILQDGSIVSLQCATSGASIYYSLTGPPAVNKTGDSTTTTFTPATGTEKFDPTKGITVKGTAGTFFNIQVVAVKHGMSDSNVVNLIYQLPAPVQAVLATPKDGEVVKGTKVVLSTTTAGATIFYETATGSSKAKAPEAFKSMVFDPAKPIIIDDTTSISVIAVKDNVSSIQTDYSYTVAKQVGAVTPSIASGGVVAKGTKITLKCATKDSKIIYTKDGSDPTDEKNTKRMFGSDIIIDADEGKSISIKAYATADGMTPSEVISLSYSVSKAGEVIIANPASGAVVKPGDKITLSSSVTGSEIYYTTDGSDPTDESENGISATIDGEYGATVVLKAVAITGGTPTTPSIFSYTIISKTPSPTANIPTNAVVLPGAQIILTATEGNIYYTTDGSEPTSSSQVYVKDSPIKLISSIVLKAIAIGQTKAPSDVVSYVYTFAGQVHAPTPSLPSGTIETGSKVELKSETEGATIYYTTNGVTPTKDNISDCITYDAPILVARPVSIRMFAVKQGLIPSVVNTATYSVEDPPPAVETVAEDETQTQKDSGKLFLFDQFVESAAGPKFEDIVLNDTKTLVVLSARTDSLEDNVQLVVERENNPAVADYESVARALEMNIGAQYDITLQKNGEPVQPTSADGVEIGLPIPEGYEDTILLICRINTNGTVTAFPTRRSGNMLFAVVDHFSKYAVAVPKLIEQQGANYQWWYILISAVVLVSVVSFIIVKKRKKQKQEQPSL